MTEDLLYGDVEMKLDLEDVFSDYKEASLKRKDQMNQKKAAKNNQPTDAQSVLQGQ